GLGYQPLDMIGSDWGFKHRDLSPLSRCQLTHKSPGRPARQEPTRLQLVDTTAGAQEFLNSVVAFLPLGGGEICSGPDWLGNLRSSQGPDILLPLSRVIRLEHRNFPRFPPQSNRPPVTHLPRASCPQGQRRGFRVSRITPSSLSISTPLAFRARRTASRVPA